MSELPGTIHNADGELIFAGDLSAPRPFQSAEEVIAAGEDAAAFVADLMGAHRNQVTSDAEVREVLYGGVEALLYTFRQLAEPNRLDHAAGEQLTAWADNFIDARTHAKAVAE